MAKLAMTLKEVADGAPFDVATIVRLLAARVEGLTGAPGSATMDAGEAGAALDGAAFEGEFPRKSAGRKKEQG